jgi:hypothetical protein
MRKGKSALFPVLSRARICADFWSMEMIRVPDMLNVMNQRDGNGEFIPFGEITWVTCNKANNTGGEKISLSNAVLNGNGNSKAEKYNPDHFANYTRNIRAADGNRIMKLHVLLITRFNGAKVIL